jgi:hypothetical protein
MHPCAQTLHMPSERKHSTRTPHAVSCCFHLREFTPHLGATTRECTDLDHHTTATTTTTPRRARKHSHLLTQEVVSVSSRLMSRVVGRQAQTVQLISSLSTAQIGLPDAASQVRASRSAQHNRRRHHHIHHCYRCRPP